jgi:hypothetical protein
MALPVKMTSAFKVLEYWTIGVLEKAKTLISICISSYYYSITPPLHCSSRLPLEGKTIEAPSGVGSKPLRTRIFDLGLARLWHEGLGPVK